jgi:hypothetical protein
MMLCGVPPPVEEVPIVSPPAPDVGPDDQPLQTHGFLGSVSILWLVLFNFDTGHADPAETPAPATPLKVIVPEEVGPMRTRKVVAEVVPAVTSNVPVKVTGAPAVNSECSQAASALAVLSWNRAIAH